MTPTDAKDDTPRTDALALLPLDPEVNPASARLCHALNLCAKLERELLAAQTENERLREQLDATRQEALAASAALREADIVNAYLQEQIDGRTEH